jgi:uncharacterized protein (DUF305 family)
VDVMMVNRRRYTIVGVLSLVVAIAGGGIAWGMGSSDQEPPARSKPIATNSPVPVIVPGRPGASASVVPSDELVLPDGSRYNTLDVWFVRMMIQHHQQAVEMAALAPSRARNPQVRAVADRIVVAQGPEIALLRSWLKERKLGESDDQGAAHDHGTMRGMASPQAISALTKATGEAFDRKFVDLMSVHHQGAIAMCGDALRVGVDERIQELATNIAAEQQIEIARMQELLAR